MNKSFKNFFALLGFASLFATNGLALAGSPEAWLSPVCYHDSLEFGNYRWSCLLPPPPVPDETPSSYELSQVVVENNSESSTLPEFALTPDDGVPPIPEFGNSVANVPSTENYDCEMMVADEVFVAPSCDQEVAPPAYFSATDIRRRDWWTPPFILRPQPPVTPFAIDFDCRTQWNMEKASPANSEVAEAGEASIPADCLYELAMDQWSHAEVAVDAIRSVDLQQVSDKSAEMLAFIAPYVTSNVSATEFSENGFTAYTYTIPYSLTASTEDTAETFEYAASNEVVSEASKANDSSDELELADGLQKLARQLDWVGLNILRVADHLDSWANQAILRKNMGSLR